MIKEQRLKCSAPDAAIEKVLRDQITLLFEVQGEKTALEIFSKKYFKKTE